MYIFFISGSLFLIMRNIWDQNCRENQNTHFVFSNFISKTVPFMRKCGKILYSRAGHRWQYGAWALRAEYLSLQTHALRLCNTHCFSAAKKLHELASMLRYTYTDCVVYLSKREIPALTLSFLFDRWKNYPLKFAVFTWLAKQWSFVARYAVNRCECCRYFGES